MAAESLTDSSDDRLRPAVAPTTPPPRPQRPVLARSAAAAPAPRLRLRRRALRSTARRSRLVDGPNCQLRTEVPGGPMDLIRWGGGERARPAQAPQTVVIVVAVRPSQPHVKTAPHVPTGPHVPTAPHVRTARDAPTTSPHPFARANGAPHSDGVQTVLACTALVYMVQNEQTLLFMCYVRPVGHQVQPAAAGPEAWAGRRKPAGHATR
jgi:hypothetical protein